MERIEFVKILDGLYTLEEFMESDRDLFDDKVNYIISQIKWDGFIEKISKKTIIGLMEKEGIDFIPIYKDPEYLVEEKFYNNMTNSYKEISSFLKSDPSGVVIFWDANNLGGSTEPNHEEYSSLILKAFGKFFKIEDWWSLNTKKELGFPRKNIRFSEGPIGERGYEHSIDMYESTGGEKFCLHQTYSGDYWMCSRSLLEKSLDKDFH